MSTKPVIEVTSLSHRYGRTRAVDDLSFRVHAGEVVGLLGHNGSGKTTTVRCLLGLLSPTAGQARVFGLDARRHGVEIRRRAGYVPEDWHAHGWMTVREMLWFVSQFHPTWDAGLEAELAARLELPLQERLRELSRGTRAKATLAAAVAFRPEALILDDPTSGLDALVRREVLEHVIELAADGGRAVLFSSHVLDEVERLADRVIILVGGRPILDRRVDELKSSFRRLTARFEGAVPPGLLEASVSREVDDGSLVAVVDGESARARQALVEAGARSTDAEELSLEDIFVEVVRAAKRGAGRDAA